jgi:hypothetical protein
VGLIPFGNNSAISMMMEIESTLKKAIRYGANPRE